MYLIDGNVHILIMENVFKSLKAIVLDYLLTCLCLTELWSRRNQIILQTSLCGKPQNVALGVHQVSNTRLRERGGRERSHGRGPVKETAKSIHESRLPQS